MIDDERLNHNNEFCKFITNVAPFDAMVAGVRDRAAKSLKRLGFEQKLQSFSDSEESKTLQEGTEELDLAAAMARLLALADKYEIFCRDMPVQSDCASDSLREALKIHFQDMVKMWAPLVKRVKTMSTAFQEGMKDLVKDTRQSGPDKAKLKLLIQNGTTSVYTSALQRCIGIVTKHCTFTGVEKPNDIEEQQRTLTQAAATEGLASSCIHLCTLEGGVTIEASPPLSSELIGDACKKLQDFNKAFDQEQVEGVGEDHVSLGMFYLRLDTFSCFRVVILLLPLCVCVCVLVNVA